ncbi:uncharacterized protein L203_102113 [Cryptococcus depauperatus CBS 7841]|uniref:SH3 domain-containing protein n=1 Tax=Cryptococcus depauperatus CBS 7841 TaxID=1295531 RepID=A0AAJ8M0E0_9TREE
MAAVAAPAAQQLLSSHGVNQDSDSDRSASPDSSSSSIQGDIALDNDQASFYHQQQQQALLYQKHHEQNGLEPGAVRLAARQSRIQMDGDSDDGFSDEGSNSDSMPDECIDFSLTYALHTFLATVEGQASVVKGDSLVLLDDANSYWWLVRVLKTEDVGYIPAENIETPYERLARLNKHRNIDLAAATQTEKQAGIVQSREKLKGAILAKARSARQGSNGSEESSTRRVVFAPPTYVEHPGVTWSSDEETTDGEREPDEVEQQEDHHRQDADDRRYAKEAMEVDESLDMEPDDGVEWADEAAEAERQRSLHQRQAQAQAQNQYVQSHQGLTQPKSNNSFAPLQQKPTLVVETVSNGLHSGSATSINSMNSPIRDPMDADEDTRRITVTPAVANGPLLPSAFVQNTQNQQRSVSGQSSSSVYSTISSVSTVRSSTPTSNTSPEDNTRKNKKTKKDDGDKKKKGLLGGLFSRNRTKDKSKSIAGGDTRSSEDSGFDDRVSEENHTGQGTPISGNQMQLGQRPDQNKAGVSQHTLKLQQQDQVRMQSYTSKYLKSSPSDHSPSSAEAAAAVAQSAAAMRLTASINGTANGQSARPSSIIVSPNPSGPPLLNVIRIFAGTKVESDASFKTALINETTSAADLIRQTVQRFRLHHVAGEDVVASYYITVKESDGSELELDPAEKPLGKFQDAVARWTHGALDIDEHGKLLNERLEVIAPTVKRESVSSISSMISLSSHPAIKKLGMDWEDDSAVKLYINRRIPKEENHFENQRVEQKAVPELQSEFSIYSSDLPTVQESPDPDNTGFRLETPDQTRQSHAKNINLTVSTNTSVATERYMSPSARFTLQLLLHPSDLPEGVAFDVNSDTLVPRSRLSAPSSDESPRQKLFTMPKNANVVDVIEQGLERYGIQEGVVDGGDEVEDKVGKRRSMTRVRYCLSVLIDGQENQLPASSKILEVYPSPPVFKPIEKSTPESRRRSRDFSYNIGQMTDIRESDPIFVLRRVGPRSLAGAKIENLRLITTPQTSSTFTSSTSSDPRSPAEIIAAQRAASRSHQLSILSSSNKSQGIDVILPSTQGTFRSSKLTDERGIEMRYSFINQSGETYDISELLEEEWGRKEKTDEHVTEEFGTGLPISASRNGPPLVRQGTDLSSDYHTAPSTPDSGAQPLQPNMEQVEMLDSPRPRSQPGKSDEDILQRAIQRASQDGQEAGLQEALRRVAERAVKEGSMRDDQSLDRDGARTPDRRIMPHGVTDNDSQNTPRASSSQSYGHISRRSSSRQTNQDYENTAASVNRIISRHRQQPSIASIMSDLEASSVSPRSTRERSGEPRGASEVDERDDSNADVSYGYEANFNDRSSTPATATSSTHPTPPFNRGAFLYNRAVNVNSPSPRTPIRYNDDFGMKDMMAVIRTRAREFQLSTKGNKQASRAIRNSLTSAANLSQAHESRGLIKTETNDVDRQLVGEKIEWDELEPAIRGCLQGVQERLDKFDKEVDDLLASLRVLGL